MIGTDVSNLRRVRGACFDRGARSAPSHIQHLLGAVQQGQRPGNLSQGATHL